MKKISLLVIISCLSFSCSLYNDISDSVYSSRIKKVAVYYHEDFEDLHILNDIIKYIQTHVKYASEEGDTWSTAEETLTRGYGDCEDFAILFMNIYYVVFGVESEMVLVDNRKIEEVKEGYVNHALVRLDNGKIISPRGGFTDITPVGYSYSFDELFN